MKSKSSKLVTDICVFAMLGSVMFISKTVMEFLPNIHLLGMLTIVYTLVYRVRALVPIYVYVFLDGIFAGFNLWWLPYLYIWAVLWGAVMLLPKKIPDRLGVILFPLICALHGLAFGVLYAPAQALMFGLDLKGTISWIIAGLPFDLIHTVSNFVIGLLIIPMKNVLLRLAKEAGNL